MVTRKPKKALSILLASTMLASMCALPTAVSAADTQVETSDLAGTLASQYKTNPSGKGAKKTITIDGDASDWSSDMLIAQGAAWDVANHWKGGHENCVLDTYALYGAWDDENLYVGWQMVNTTDTWARSGDGPLSDGGRVLDVPLILALSLDEGSTSMSNKNTSGGAIWGQKMGLEFDTHVDRLLYMSGKPGLGKPSMFKAVDSEGNTDYEDGCIGFTEGGIEYKMATTNICSDIIGLNNSEDPSDVSSDSADWVDYKTFQGSAGKHDTTYDSFYEIKIPLSTLGITRSHIESNGVGAMLVATRGESALDCIPYDLSMVDNALGDYSSDPSTSAEKDDIDVVTASLARIGNSGGVIIPTSKPTSKPTTATQKPTSATQSPTSATTGGDTDVTGTKSVTVAKGDVVTFNIKATSSSKKIGAYRLTTAYSKAAFELDTSYSTDGVNTLGATNGTEIINTHTAGKVKAAVLAKDGSPYNISSATTLQTIKLKALKAGTFDIKYTVDELLSSVGDELVSNGKVKSSVTVTASTSIKQATTPVTGSTSIAVKKDDTVVLNVNLKTETPLYGFNTNINYDSTLLTLSKVEYPNFTDGSVTKNTSTAGLISAIGVGSPTKTYNYKTERTLVRATFKAKAAGTAKFTHLMKEVVGLDLKNQFDESTGKSKVSTTTSNLVAKVSTPVTYIGSYSNSIKVAKGDVVAYTVKVKTSSKFNKYVLTTKYDSAAFDRYTTYSTDGVNTIKASQGGKESVDVATAGTIKATVTAATDSPYTASTSTNIVIIKLKAKKAGTFTISSTLDSMLNDKNTALSSSNVSVTGSLAKSEIDDTKLTSVSRSIQVKLGEVIVYTVKAKTSTKFNTYKITTTYDSEAFDRYTGYSTDGVTTIKLTQNGTESVNTSTAGKIVATATCKSGTPYTASSETNLQIVKLKAKKAGTFTIGATINYMKNTSNTAMTTSNVSIRNTASVVIPFTDSRTVTVTKGQTVDYIIAVTLPNKGYDISGWTVDVNYDSDILGVSSTFANGKKFAVGDAAINYATGATTTSASLPGGNMATANFSTAGKVTVMDVKSDGLGLKGKTTKLVCVRFTAKKAGTAILSYSVTKFVNTKMTNVYINSKYQPINDAEFKMYVKKF